VSYCHNVFQCDTFHGCHTCALCHTRHIYHCHVSLIIQKCHKRPLVSNFNKVRWVSGVKKCVLGLLRTALLSAEGKNWVPIPSYHFAGEGKNWVPSYPFAGKRSTPYPLTSLKLLDLPLPPLLFPTILWPITDKSPVSELTVYCQTKRDHPLCHPWPGKQTNRERDRVLTTQFSNGPARENITVLIQRSDEK
jgi:hypothetical protein